MRNKEYHTSLFMGFLAGFGLYALVFVVAVFFGWLLKWNLPQDALLIAGGIAVVMAVVVSYRKQDVDEAAALRDALRFEAELTSRARNDRSDQFARSVEMLGSDRPNVRMAGAYALAAVADQWQDLRQTTVDVLCGYLRLPYRPGSPNAQQQAQEREVRLAIISILQEHLRHPDSNTNWCERRFDFRGAYFDGGDFSDSSFFGERVNFDLCTFEPTTSPIWFDRMQVGCKGSNTHMSFDGAILSDGVKFDNIRIAEGSSLRFTRAEATSGFLPDIRVASPDDAQRIKDFAGLIFGAEGNSR